MRTIRHVLLLLLLSSTPLLAQDVAPGAPAGPGSATARALTRLENDWARGLVARDTALFRRLLAPGFVYTEDAQMMSADDVVRGVVGSDRVSAARNEDMRVHDHGGTAVVTGILIVDGTGETGSFSHRYRFTDTWLRSRGRWRVIAAQDYLIPR